MFAACLIQIIKVKHWLPTNITAITADCVSLGVICWLTGTCPSELGASKLSVRVKCAIQWNMEKRLIEGFLRVFCIKMQQMSVISRSVVQKCL